MIYIDEIKNLKLYNKPFLLPSNIKNKKKGNAIMLLTPNMESSIGLMNHKLLINKYYNSYYLEKNVSFYINNENGLENYNNLNYVHESEIEENAHTINEGVYNYFNKKIIFNGYNDDVNEIRKYINLEKIEYYNQLFRANIKYPVSVTVYRNIQETPKNNKNTINVFTYLDFDSRDYEEYCREIMIEMIIKSINPDCNEYITKSVCLVVSGNYDKYSQEINNTEMNYMCRTIESLVKETNGYNKLVKIIKNNDIDKLFIKGVKYDINNLLKEDTLNPIQKLKRNITYISRKGSAHKLNKVSSDIEKTIDPNQNNPEFVENNENYSLTNYIDNEYEVTENYIRTDDTITYFGEATESAQLKRLLYRERLRTNKDVLLLYDEIKEKIPDIKYTYLDYKRYKELNLFVDLSYYNKLFFENNMYKLSRGVDLYLELISKFINDDRLKENGYNNRTIMIPINDWDMNPDTRMWIYSDDINPISVLYRLMNTNLIKLKTIFGNLDFVFFIDQSYFKINFSTFNTDDINKFLYFIKTLRSSNDMPEIIADEKKDSNKAIVNTIIDDIESSQNIKISHLTGDTGINVTKSKDIDNNISPDNNDDSTIVKLDADKKEIIDKVTKAAEKSDTIEDTMELLNKDDAFKKMLLDLSSEEQNGNIINNARASRILKLDEELLNKEVKGMKIQDILAKKELYNEIELEKTALPIDSINPEWQELTYMNMANQYDPNIDIVAMLTSLSKKTYPVSIRDINVDDTSTSEDYIYTYKVEMESHTGKRFTLKFDIPKFKNNQYMVLRGNRKTISSQSFLMPLIKTDTDTVQMISNYNKIFIRRFRTTTGKSYVTTDKLIKVFNNNNFKNIKITKGNNEKICLKYELPIDYIDLANVFSKIETNNYIFWFNQKEFRETYKDIINLSEGLPIAIAKDSGKVQYYNRDIKDIGIATVSDLIRNMILEDVEFKDAYIKVNESSRYTYSKASILNTEVPIIVLTAYSEGLIKVLNKANIIYEITEARPLKDKFNNNDVIKFSDGYLSYKLDYNSSLLMNGLKECPTDQYSISDINKKSMYLDFLDLFGGRIKADGIDNFYDMMIETITEDVLKHYKLPVDYVQLLLYANILLSDNKYIKHGDMAGRRLRRNEIIAGYFYKALSSAYGSYTTQIKHGRETIMSMKQSAVIDAILTDPTGGDLSTINAVNENESYNTVTTKGLSGMNSDRSYSLDKRSFDDSMLNVLGMSTGFAGNVGINRQATINANVSTVRGYINASTKDDMNSINTLCMTEALTPYGTTRDDPFRVAMNFVQTSRHGMRCRHADPSLVTNGADQALPYLISDLFAYKSKYEGIVKELTDEYMVVEYTTGECEYIDLTEKVEKNSSSGFFVTLKLDTDLKEGNKIKKGQILAYDKSSFDPTIGVDDNPAYEIGTLAKCALIDNDEGFEDSAIISDALAEAMTSDVVEDKRISIPKSTNIYNMVQKGQKIEDGDTLMIMQSPYDDEDANTLLKNLVGNEEDISDLGRIKIKSKVTGIVQDIEIYRTVELDELSESLQKLCKKYESGIKSKKQVMKKYNIKQEEELAPDYKLEPTGKLKGSADGVLIIFYLKYEDKMSIGDKLIYWSAQKGVVKYIIPKGKEPSTKSRPNEKLHTLVSISASNGRMVTSIQNIGVINRLLIEASRKAKDMAGIRYDINLL